MPCYVASGYGECCCLGFIPGGMIALRTHMRLSYGIQGTICQDSLALIEELLLHIKTAMFPDPAVLYTFHHIKNAKLS
ncbi:hypothetical protein scyTo_0021541 [Scyliorhinus torazame]|uniref:Uncharacterized protein n=1 Tax=Scyliorhinus torazame TaxID=75743 RepID=A0A401Q9V2_SCYTO|nr:hypothetical protein [Scyliorhinus torazame]